MPTYAVESKRQAMETTGIVNETPVWETGVDGKRRPSRDQQDRHPDTGMPLWDVEVKYVTETFGRQATVTANVQVGDDNSAGNSQVAVQASKRVAYFWRNLAIRESLEFYKSVKQQLMLCDDVLEGLQAFVEKRDPVFSNRWPENGRCVCPIGARVWIGHSLSACCS